jgi:hypothetical protein
MKTVFSIVFLTAFLWQPFYQAGYIAYWEINKENIIKTECINRLKPMLHCNGKCQLYRELKKAADEEAENNKLPVAVLKLKSLDTFIEIGAAWYWEVIPVETQQTAFHSTSESLLHGFSNDLLRPPQKIK